MIVALIAAVADNGVIGRGGALPWRIPADLRHFRERTTGHHVVMGRKTWDSIGRALPNRTNVVVTRDATLSIAGATVVHDLSAALELARAASEHELFVIGGAQIYREALPIADRIYLTRVHADVDGDAKFPALPTSWVEVAREDHLDEPLPYSFCLLERPGPSAAGT